MPTSLRVLLCLFVMVAVGWNLGGSRAATGQQPDKGPAFAEPPTDDLNYTLLGEYVGTLKTGDGEPQAVGLQVRPVGGDNFEAVSFLGGLPGQAEHQEKPAQMIGRRAGELLILSGQEFAIFVERDHCVIIDQRGEQLGRLERTNRLSPTLGASPPEGAIVIFDGSGTDQFTVAEITPAGLLSQGADLKPMFYDFDLHAEFRVPYMPVAQGQARGNSGLYLQSRYECQILDSFAQESLFNGLGALYRFRKPDVNMALPPLVWQTYDVHFTAARWAADGSKLRNARITSWVNGVKVQDDVELPTKTGNGKPEEPSLLPIRIQDHGDPVRFRNIWIVDRGLTPGIEFPVMATEEESRQAAAAVETPIEPAVEPADVAATDEPATDATAQDTATKSDDADAGAKEDSTNDNADQPVNDTESADEPSPEPDASADQ